MKKLLFGIGVLLLGLIWFKYFNFDIFLPTIAFMIYLRKNDYKNITMIGAIVYSAVGTLLWYQDISLALMAVFFIAMGFVLSAKLFQQAEKIKNILTGWSLKVIAVVLYDNVASLPIFAGAFISGGFSALFRQVALGIPFTLTHILSFVIVYLSWQLVYQLSKVMDISSQPELN